MSELIKLIGNLTFENVKTIMKPLNISVKDNADLYILNFSDDSDFNNKVVRQANGAIFEKETNKVIHYAFEKSYDGLEGLHEGKDLFNKDKLPDDYQLELFFEGSMIKLYWYNEKWHLATSKHIDASKNKWTSDKNFSVLFEEALKNSFNCDYNQFLESLDKKFCYTYLLQHPENKMTYPIATALTFQINRVNLETLDEERPESENLKVTKTIDDKLESNYILYFKNDDGKTTTRVKLLTEQYIRMSQLRGCYPDIGLTYINLLHLGVERDINDLKKLFPHCAGKFDWIETLIVKTVKTVHSAYLKKYVEKSEEEVPEKYKRTLQQIHGYYKRTKTPIRTADVYLKLLSYQPKLISSLIGYKYSNQ